MLPGPPPPPSAPASTRAQALAWIDWARAAGGRFSFLDAQTPALTAAVAPPPAAVDPLPGAIDPRRAPEEGAPEGRVREERAPDEFDSLRRDAMACRRCGLCETRRTVVFGEGHRRPRLMVVGEAPGEEEDRTGRPFVGRAGKLLTDMLAAIGLSRDDVYIANVLKCRPPANRPPRPEEVAACRPYLLEQARLLRPELVLLLGKHAANAVLGTDRGITSIRGTMHATPEGLPCLPTFHPSYLLREPKAKREAWIDMQLVAKTLGLTIPDRTPSPRTDPDSAD